MHGLRQREPRIEIKALTEGAEGLPCFVRLSACRYPAHEFTVWAHSNALRHGKGVGGKSHDIYGFLACDRCHMQIDHGGTFNREEKDAIVQRARDDTLKFLVQIGRITFKSKREVPWNGCY